MGERITEEEVRRRLDGDRIARMAGADNVLRHPEAWRKTLGMVGVRWVEDHYEEGE